MKGEGRAQKAEGSGTPNFQHPTPNIQMGTTEPDTEGFITKEVVAVRLSVTPETVRRWASAGKLPSHHFGRRLRFKWSEVRAALANMTKGTKETNELA